MENRKHILVSTLLLVSFACFGQKSNAKNQFVYVTNFANNTISTCPVHKGGTLAPCTADNPGSTLSGPSSISLNPTGSIAYISNFSSNTISVCPINAYGTIGTCTASPAVFNGPVGVEVNDLGTYAYVVNYSNNTLSGCPLNADGSLGTCITITDTSFLNPDVVALNQSGTFAYVTNSNTTNGSVSICPINADGSFGTCTVNADSTFHGSAGMAINPLGTFLYVINGSNEHPPQTVSRCPINSNGSLSACTAINSTTFQGVNFGKMALNPANTRAYVANQTSNWIAVCSVPLTGNLKGCVSLTDPTLDQPQGVAVFSYATNPVR